jgi:hypothetical protein
METQAGGVSGTGVERRSARTPFAIRRAKNGMTTSPSASGVVSESRTV